MPRLSLELRRLNEEHRLHAFDAAVPEGQMRRRDLAEHPADARMHGEFAHDRTDIVRLVDAEDIGQRLRVAHRGRQWLETLAGISAASKLERIGFELLDLLACHQ